jgi:hypothetical protein
MNHDLHPDLNELLEGQSNDYAADLSARDRRRYDGAFKLNAILKLLRGEKQVDVAHELGVSQPLLSIWKRKALEAVCREFGVVSSSAGRQGKSLNGGDSYLLGDQRVSALAETLDSVLAGLVEKSRLLDEKMSVLERKIS